MIRRLFLSAGSAFFLFSTPTAAFSASLPVSAANSETRTVTSPEDRERVTALYNKGNRLLDAKRYAEAERAFLDALKLAPNIAAIHHGLGLVYLQTQDYELAVLHLEEAFRREPNRVKTVYMLARAYANVGENDKAEEGYKRAVQIDPNFSPAYQELAGIYYRKKKWDEAFEALDHAKTLDPGSAHTWTLIGVTGIHAGRLDVALDAVTELRRIGQPDEARRLEYLIYSSKEKEAKEAGDPPSKKR